MIIGNAKNDVIPMIFERNIFSFYFFASTRHSPISDTDRNFQTEKRDPSKGVRHVCVSSVIFAHVPEAACCNHLSVSIVSYTHSFPPVNSAGLAGFTWQKRRPERERPMSRRKRIGKSCVIEDAARYPPIVLEYKLLQPA